MKTHNHDANDQRSHTAHAVAGAVVEAQNRLQSMLDSVGETYTQLKEKAVDSAKTADKFAQTIRLLALPLALVLCWAFC